MKRYNGIYEQVFQFDRLHEAYTRARRGKRHTSEVLRFEHDLEGEIIQIANELIWEQYETGPYYRFYVHEPKTRLVAALPFRDRVVQHSLVAQMEPIWERRFICHSYACRPGKGLHRGAEQAQQWLREVARTHGQAYVLKADVSRYFPSIDHDVLFAQLARRIRCRRTLDLCAGIIASWPEGLPIGNLTSQLWANVYLHDFDMHVKQGLGEHRYMRYMDDFIVVHHDKRHLHRLRRHIEQWMAEELRLTLNNKTQVFPVSRHRGRALDFLGYRMWLTHKRLRKSSVLRMRRRLRHMQGQFHRGEIDFADVRQRIKSWEGHAARADTHRIRTKLFRDHVFRRAA